MVKAQKQAQTPKKQMISRKTTDILRFKGNIWRCEMKKTVICKGIALYISSENSLHSLTLKGARLGFASQ